MGTRTQNAGPALLALVRLGRPQFLIGGFLLYGLGAAAAVALLGVPFARVPYALGQAAVSAIQLMTHYANEFFDQAADRANTTPTRWSGGSRVLVAGALSPRWALWAARLCAGLGMAIVAAIAWRARVGGGAGAGDGGAAATQLLAAAVLLMAQIVAWFYSAPPLSLHSRGLGEAATALVVTGLTPLSGFLLQARDLSGALTKLPLLGAVLWPVVALQFAMLLAIEFPDAAGDAAVGKRTLVVRLGGARAAALYQVVLVLAYGALPLFLLAGAPPPVLWAAGALVPVAAWQFWRLGRGAWVAPRQWEGLAFRGVALLVATAAAELAGFLWMLGG